MIMRNDILHRASPRRETATRSAFFIWMAAYAAVLVAIVAVHSLGVMSNGTTIDASGMRTQQAKMTGQPQSSIAGRALPGVVLVDVDG
jgi:hypothetical protein